VRDLIADGFGALILMEEGRRYCAELARILDDAALGHTATAGPTFAAAAAGPDLFAGEFRDRIDEVIRVTEHG
jgi:hypothetical protein